jgi:selenide,water dikinase
LRRLPAARDPNLLVGTNSADDAGVYRLGPDLALVQTVDFFTPVVDDPYVFGQIAAANSLSDVYAMGGRPLTALSILGVPDEVMPPAVINTILRGGAVKSREARCLVVGGHTIRNPELFYGLSVTGLVSPRRLITNAAARAGDLLVLTKPLGLGIISTGIKQGVTSPALARKAIGVMRRLNTAGAELGRRGLVRAGTDVTGFGLLGHLATLCRASGVSAELTAGQVPVFGLEVWDLIAQDCVPGGTRQNLRTADACTHWGNATEAQKYLLADAQTSGGLLMCVPPSRLGEVRSVLKRHRTPCAAIIGRIIKGRAATIRVVA